MSLVVFTVAASASVAVKYVKQNVHTERLMLI